MIRLCIQSLHQCTYSMHGALLDFLMHPITENRVQFDFPSRAKLITCLYRVSYLNINDANKVCKVFPVGTYSLIDISRWVKKNIENDF